MDASEATFEADVIDASATATVVVDFWADWCGPCKVLGPVLEKETAERQLALVKVDVDANPMLAQEYSIRGIPAVKAFRNGHVVAEFVGARSPAAVGAFLDELTKPPVAETVDDPALADALAAKNYEQAFDLLLERVPTDPDASRELMVRLFGELGHEHPLTIAYRRKLASALY